MPHTLCVSQASAARPRPHDADSLLRVAVAVFNERGYDGARMTDLAQAAGITKSAIYHHVRSKEELLRLGLERALGGIFAVLEEPAAREGPAILRLRHVLRRTTEVLVAELPYVTLLLRVRGNTATERWALEQRRTFDARVAALVAEAADDGALRSDVDPRLATRLLFGMVNSIVEWHRPGPGRAAAPIAAAVEALAVDGLSRRA